MIGGEFGRWRVGVDRGGLPVVRGAGSPIPAVIPNRRSFDFPFDLAQGPLRRTGHPRFMLSEHP